MKKLFFSNDELAGYFNGQLKHRGYNETVQDSLKLRRHADEICHDDLIEERRPSESLDVKDYRKKIWVPVTQPIYNKVEVELDKIFRSADWTIKYNNAVEFPSILPAESLQSYCEDKYPTFSSMTNWLRSYAKPVYLKDSNAVVAVMPMEAVEKNQYVRPFGFVFASENVIDYKDDDYAVIRSTDKVIYQDGAGRKSYGNVYYILTTQYIQRWEQTNGTQQYLQKSHWEHNIGYLPAYKVKGLIKKSLDDLFIYKSRLHPMVPRLNEYVREYSDLQAGVVSHLYLEKWEINPDDCPTCKGKGRVCGDYGCEKECNACAGSGAKRRGPYAVLQLKPPMAGEAQMPTPPIGYVTKDVAIIKLQDERLDRHELKALSAVNMENLAEVPLAQSGVAKEVDRDAQNNLVHGSAEDLVFILDMNYKITCDMRYAFVISNQEKRKEMLPFIPVPEKFDLLSASYLELQIKTQKENNVNPIIVNATTKEYVQKKFAGDSLTQKRILAVLNLDPLAGISEDDKMSRLSNGGITKENYIVSCNIEAFIDRAAEENGDNFYTMKPKEQKAMLFDFAKEQIEASAVKVEVLDGNADEGSGSAPKKHPDGTPITVPAIP